ASGHRLPRRPRNPLVVAIFTEHETMKRLSLGRLLMIGVVAAGAAALTPGPVRPADEPGWVNLLNGKDLDAWVQHGRKGEDRVEAGQILGTSTPNTPNSFLCTKRDYADFVLELEFKVQSGLNSGVQIRSQCFDEPKTLELGGKKIKVPAGRVHGYQV